jgi:hypothetical protein
MCGADLIRKARKKITAVVVVDVGGVGIYITSTGWLQLANALIVCLLYYMILLLYY